MVRQRIDREKRMILYLAALIVVVYGITFGVKFLQSAPGEEKAEQLGELRLAGTPDSIEVINGTEPYQLTKSGTEWVCDAYPDLRLSQSRLAFLNLTLKELEPERIIPEGAAYLEQFGLNNPHSVITVNWSGGEKVYRIGAYNAVMNAYYLAVDQSQRVYLISGDDVGLINRTLPELVEEPVSVGISPGQIDQITVKGTEEYEMERKGDTFEVRGEAFSFESSDYRVSKIYSAFNAASYSCRYYDAGQPDFLYCGLDKADVEIAFFLSDGVSFSLKVGTGKDGLHYMNENNDKVIYQIDDGYYQEILERTKLSNLGYEEKE